MAKPKKRQGKANDGANLKEATVLIPLTYNDGTKVPPAIIRSIRDEIFIAFGAWTTEGSVTGAYRMRATGQKRVENLLKISVILKAPEGAEFEGMVARWCAMLEQEVMLLKVADFVVKFVAPQPESEKP
jgi:hypothetical protein